LITVSGSAPDGGIGAKALATAVAPRETKKEKNIQRAIDARADVAMLRKTTEKSKDMPNQKETYTMLMMR